MRKSVLVCSKGILAFVAISLLFGCITIGGDKAPVEAFNEEPAGNAGLRSFADDLANPPWPKAPRLSVTRVVLGGGDQNDQTAGYDPVATYLDILAANSDRKAASRPDAARPRISFLLRDAGAQLHTASAMNTLALETATSSRLSVRDITALETAIIALRENRSVFIDTLKTLSNAGEEVAPGEIRALKTSFVNIGRRLGKTADILADQLSGAPTPLHKGNNAVAARPVHPVRPAPAHDLPPAEFADLD